MNQKVYMTDQEFTAHMREAGPPTRQRHPSRKRSSKHKHQPDR